MNPLQILEMPEVHQELALSEQQVTQASERLVEMREEIREIADVEGLEPQERRARMAEIQEDVAEITQEALADIEKLLEPKQRERFEQLRWQRQGPAALLTSGVAEKLEMSEETMATIREKLATARAGGGGRRMREMSDEERQTAMEEMRKANEKTATEIMALLSDAQRAKWSEMQGAKFEFPQRAMMGRGEGGGQGRRGDRPARPGRPDGEI